MLKALFTRLFGRQSGAKAPLNREESLLRAEDFCKQGDVRSAIAVLRAHLVSFPFDVPAMNDLGCFLFDIGEQQEAFALFERAFSLDDSFLPVAVNYSRSLMDRKRINEGMLFLRRAKIINPEDPNVAGVFAGMALVKGDAETAMEYAKNAWMGIFDNLRLANCYLFNCTYANISGERLAAEHRFWAETLIQRPDASASEDVELPALPPKTDKIRIAYWSPDLRNHSVGFFARPLFQHHDRNVFEVIVYHDFGSQDATTEVIKSGCDHFIPVASLSDAHLVQMMGAHELDILVELAGHSSANRLNLLAGRYAKVQISGLGYPPTTGLSSIDAKIMDVHIADENSARFYTEAPLLLDQSFWCFDPGEDVAVDKDPPCVRNGYVTFACVGNIAKISDPILKSWLRILDRVPGSRLMIRSISFADPAALSAFRERCELGGFDMGRLDLRGPAQGLDYLASYNEIDIVLDTYPFNGGTTTCFATYMGVPVLSLVGDSLVSRMGKSILTNLGLKNWIVDTAEAYVEQAVAHAADIDFLRDFRVRARDLYAGCALGNGEMFTRNFERKCVELLNALPSYVHQVAALPEEELVSRAYRVCRNAQFEAARRIVDHCLRVYPDSGSAHVLWTQRLTANGQFAEAAEYLSRQLENIAARDRFKVLVNMARFNILAGRDEVARSTIVRARECIPSSVADRLQFDLLWAYHVQPSIVSTRPERLALGDAMRGRAILVLAFSDDFAFAAALESRMCEQVGRLASGRIEFRQCEEKLRWRTYVEALNDPEFDVVLIVHKHVDIRNPGILLDVLAGLERCDVLGIGGAKTWERLDWRLNRPEEKVGCHLIPSGEREGFYEINHTGVGRQRYAEDLVVLEGSFLAIHTPALRGCDIEAMFDPALEEAGLWQEEFFSHMAYQAGLRLGADLNLGLVTDWRVPLLVEHIGEAREAIAERFSFDPFMEDDGDRKVVSIPIESADLGISIIDYYLI